MEPKCLIGALPTEIAHCNKNKSLLRRILSVEIQWFVMYLLYMLSCIQLGELIQARLICQFDNFNKELRHFTSWTLNATSGWTSLPPSNTFEEELSD